MHFSNFRGRFQIWKDTNKIELQAGVLPILNILVTHAPGASLLLLILLLFLFFCCLFVVMRLTFDTLKFNGFNVMGSPYSQYRLRRVS